MRVILAVLALAVSFLNSGCSLLAEYRTVDKESVVNKLGHVVGHREVLRNNGEYMPRVTFYTPRLNDDGKIVGYEEKTRGGAIIRDLNGDPIGNRFRDLRSWGSNPGNTGITVVFGPAPPRATVPLAEVRRDLLAVR